MFRFYCLASALLMVASAQSYHGDPRTAAIISEQRYLSGDGKFGAAYTQEDGINFKEETDADGTRRGSYSYVDPSGQRRTISYTAGKNGFVASGDHLPVAPAPPPQPAPQAAPAPVPSYQQPTYQQPAYQPQAAVAPRSFNQDFDSTGAYDERYNDPNFEGNKYPSAPVAPVVPQAHYQRPVQPVIPQNNFNHIPSPTYTTTPNPHRFLPPGKLSLSRTPDGFSYSFNKA